MMINGVRCCDPDSINEEAVVMIKRKISSWPESDAEFLRMVMEKNNNKNNVSNISIPPSPCSPAINPTYDESRLNFLRSYTLRTKVECNNSRNSTIVKKIKNWFKPIEEDEKSKKRSGRGRGHGHGQRSSFIGDCMNLVMICVPAKFDVHGQRNTRKVAADHYTED
ncbi:hypothetical protein ACFE04_000965 [Oxalis oulophora]